MFKYTNYAEESPKTQPKRYASPAQRQRAPSPDTAKSQLRNTTIPKPKVPMHSSGRSVSGSRKGTALNEKIVSERYTNRTYNRIPSPKCRFQTNVNAMKERPPFAESRLENQQGRSYEREQQSKQQAQYMPPKRSNSCFTGRKRELDLECVKSNIQIEVDNKPRPKTANNSTGEIRLEQKVLQTVKKVLSRAVLQQGKIDETNLGNIIDSMRQSLSLETSSDDLTLSEINIELKPSRTTVNERNSQEENTCDRKSRPVAGIVRKDFPSPVLDKKPYRKIYDQNEQSSMNRDLCGDSRLYVCADVPDLVFPNFPSSRKSSGKNTFSKQNFQFEAVEQEVPLNQFEVGDSQTKDNHFWNSSEDAKLHHYIGNLIQNMKSQVNCDSQGIDTDGEIDSHGTRCRAFCVCKVCIPKNNQLRLEKEPSIVNGREQEPIESTQEVAEQKPIESEETKSKPRLIMRRPRPLRPSSRGPEIIHPEMCKVLRNTNPNFKPESTLNTSVIKNPSYTVVPEAAPTEDRDDMYLQRRMRKPPSRRSSAKMN